MRARFMLDMIDGTGRRVMTVMGIAALEATIATEWTSRGMLIGLQGRVAYVATMHSLDCEAIQLNSISRPNPSPDFRSTTNSSATGI